MPAHRLDERGAARRFAGIGRIVVQREKLECVAMLAVAGRRIGRQPTLSEERMPADIAAIRFARAIGRDRSEERRVGQEWVSTCKSRWSPDHLKKKTKKKQNH